MAVGAQEKPDNNDPDPNPLGLDAGEIALLNSQVETGAGDAGYLAIYRYADGLDWFVMTASTVSAVAAGATMPLMTVGLPWRH